MRKTRVITLAIAAAFPLLTVTTAAHAAPRTAEKFVATFQTLKGVDQPVRVAATGPVQGAGVATQTEKDTPTGEVVHFTWHFAHGTVTLEAIEDFSLDFDPTSCTAKATGTGTWTIIDGTGAYTGASGNGTFTDHGSLTGSRDASGACQGPDSGGAPKTAIFTLRGHGTASLR
jgi:hypothetical protein